MDYLPNWKSFYLELAKIGPQLLDGVHPSLHPWIREQARDSDAFWSDSLYGTLEACWGDDQEQAIRETLKVWVDNI